MFSEKRNKSPKEHVLTSLAVGDRIRILRMNQRRTLQDVADGSGLSKSMI
jgi:hypothetical protein